MKVLNPKFRLKCIMVQGIREAIVKFTTSKGFGNDTISSYFLKLLAMVRKLHGYAI